MIIRAFLPAAYCDPLVGITANSDNFLTCITSDIFLKGIASVASLMAIVDMNAKIMVCTLMGCNRSIGWMHNWSASTRSIQQCITALLLKLIYLNSKIVISSRVRG